MARSGVRVVVAEGGNGDSKALFVIVQGSVILPLGLIRLTDSVVGGGGERVVVPEGDKIDIEALFAIVEGTVILPLGLIRLTDSVVGRGGERVVVAEGGNGDVEALFVIVQGSVILPLGIVRLAYYIINTRNFCILFSVYSNGGIKRLLVVDDRLVRFTERNHYHTNLIIEMGILYSHVGAQFQLGHVPLTEEILHLDIDLRKPPGESRIIEKIWSRSVGMEAVAFSAWMVERALMMTLKSSRTPCSKADT